MSGDGAPMEASATAEGKLTLKHKLVGVSCEAPFASDHMLLLLSAGNTLALSLSPGRLPAKIMILTFIVSLHHYVNFQSTKSCTRVNYTSWVTKRNVA